MQLRRHRMEEKNHGSLVSWNHVKSVFYGGQEKQLLDGQVNQDLTTGFFNVKLIGDSNKNLFSGSGRGTNVTGNSSRQGEERIWSI